MITLTWSRDPVIVGTLFVPAIWILITLIARGAMKAGQTSGADVISVLIGFDVGVILDPSIFTHLAASERVKGVSDQAIVVSSVAFFFTCLICWIVAMTIVEPRLARNVSRRAGWFAAKASPYLWGATSWGVCWLLVCAHIWNLRGEVF